MKVVLTIAGTDPSGAAGIQADLHTVRDHGCHGVSVITSVLAQNTQGVQRVQPMSGGLVQAQLDSVFDDFDVAAIKVGLVPNHEVLEVVAAVVDRAPVVWDPVLASGDGVARLFDGDAQRLLAVLREARIVTPNVPEIATLTRIPVMFRAEASEAASTLSTLGPDVLLKLGHLQHTDGLQDIWASDGVAQDLACLPAVADDVRGTGCQLSSAIASNIASGRAPIEAVEAARTYLNELLTEQALPLGRGRRLVVRRGLRS